eukprot:6201280-Pleurochrysis_carterae.AAC.13
MLGQLNERGLIKHFSEVVGHLDTRRNNVRLDQAVELALAAVGAGTRGRSTPSADAGAAQRTWSYRNLGEAVDPFVARGNEVRLDRAVELSLAKVLAPALVVLTRRHGQLFNSCTVIHGQHGGAAVMLGANGVKQMGEKIAKERVPPGSNTAGCSFSSTGTISNLEEAGAPMGRVDG